MDKALFVCVVIYILFNFINFTFSVSANCPCSSADLCKPVVTRNAKEMVVFGGTNWKKWNWTEITNLVMLSSPESNDLYCFAHSKGVRVTQLVSVSVKDFPKLSNHTFRKQVVTSWINSMLKHNLDGLNIDIEGPAFTKDIVDGISALTQETYQTVKQMNSNYVVTFDVPYSPYLAACISAYCYDFVAIANATDYMVVMDYDATIDILIASANSPYNLVKEAYGLYIKNLSISPNKLVMVVPWYGYDYSCSHFYNDTGKDLCLIVDGGKAAVNFAAAMKKLPLSLDGLKWDPAAKSPFFTIKENGVYHQLQFDNLQSLILKYKLAVDFHLGGLGMWTADDLDYISTDPKTIQQTSSMWNTITAYMQILKAK